MSFEPPPPPREVRELPRGRVLVIAPHPDDELAGPGGALLRHVAQGDQVSVVVVFDGTLGDPQGRYAGQNYKGIREAESRGVARDFLKTGDVTFLGFMDGVTEGNVDEIYPNLPPDPKDKRRVLIDGLASHLEAHIERVQPRVLYCPWVGEVHTDHWACGLAVERLQIHRPDLFTSCSVMGYEVWSTLSPSCIIEITDVMDRKMAAMRRYVSQMDYAPLDEILRGMNQYRAMLLPWEADCSVRYAEVFTGSFDLGDQA